MAKLTSLKLIELTDRELLGVLMDVADQYGRASVDDITDRLGIKHQHPRNCVTARLAWLKRYHMVEWHAAGEGYENASWSLTEEGAMLFSGKLKPTIEKALAALTDGDRWALVTEVTRGYDELGDAPANMVRREFVHHIQRRRALLQK